MKNKKYYELYSSVKNEILSGVYKPNEKLPSKRTAADMTGMSLITVEKAYSMLEDEGYIYSAERKGYFVSDIDYPSYTDKSPEKLHLEPIETAAEKEDFEYSLWFKTVRKVLNDYNEKLFVKSPNKGCAILRNTISEYLLRYRKMFAQPANIIIGSGAEQLYEIAIQLLGCEKTVGTENPCYEKITTVYDGIGVKHCPLTLENDGIKISELYNKDFDVLHVTPFHSFPSGITTSMEKRYKYLRIAKQKNIFIIEDDYDSEFYKSGFPLETLYSLSNDENVIYINTFSKSLSPSMRLGYMIIPQKLMKKYEEKLSNLSCSVPVLDQYVLAEFISSGNFERHLNRIRRKIRADT